MKIHIRSLPKTGALLLSSSSLTLSDEISPSQFTQIQHEPGSRFLLTDAFSYELNDAWGNSEIGLAITEAARTTLGSVEARAVSLIGLGPNLIFTHAAELPANAGQIRIELASSVPFGQLMMGSRVIEVGRTPETLRVTATAHSRNETSAGLKSYASGFVERK
jgi:hypothetical protein